MKNREIQCIKASNTVTHFQNELISNSSEDSDCTWMFQREPLLHIVYSMSPLIRVDSWCKEQMVLYMAVTPPLTYHLIRTII